MPSPSGFLAALGAAFGGYAQDEDMRRQRDMLATREQRQSAMDALQTRNIESEIAARNAPKPVTPQYDSERGGWVRPGQPFEAVPGLPPKTLTPPKSPWEAAGFRTPGELLRWKAQEANATRGPDKPPTPQLVQGVSGGDSTFGEYDPQTHAVRPIAGMTPKNTEGQLPPAQANQVKLQQAALLNMNKAVGELQRAVKKHGMSVMPGADRGEIEALQANAMIQFKEAANLGALSGPDMGLIEGALGKATSPTQFLRGGAGGVMAALRAAQQSLQARAGTMETVYGVKMPSPIMLDPDDAPPTAPAPRATPDTGNVNLGGKPTLSVTDRARARSDPKFAAWLRSQGLLP